LKRSGGGLLLLSYVAFVSLGLPDTVLGVAWPSLRRGFVLAQADVGAALTASVAGYLVSSTMAGRLTSRFGVGGLLAGSSATVALGLAGCAVAPTWWTFVSMAAIVGLGSGAVDAGINGYAAHHFSARHVNWLHGFWSVGATIGPVVMTASVASATYRLGYAALAAAIAAMGLAFARTRRAWDDPVKAAASAERAAPPPATASAVLRRGRAWLQMAIFFLYTGVELGVGQWCFTVLREARGLGVEAAGTWTAAYWASHTAGRFVLGSVVERVGPDRLLRATSAGALVAAVLFAASDGLAGRVGLVALGACFGPFFPTLMARTPARLGGGAVHAVGFQVGASTLGTAALPSAAGLLATFAGVNAIAAALAVATGVVLVLHEVLVAITVEGSRTAAPPSPSRGA
jgi:fucose permease